MQKDRTINYVLRKKCTPQNNNFLKLITAKARGIHSLFCDFFKAAFSQGILKKPVNCIHLQLNIPPSILIASSETEIQSGRPNFMTLQTEKDKNRTKLDLFTSLCFVYLFVLDYLCFFVYFFFLFLTLQDKTQISYPYEQLSQRRIVTAR